MDSTLTSTSKKKNQHNAHIRQNVTIIITNNEQNHDDDENVDMIDHTPIISSSISPFVSSSSLTFSSINSTSFNQLLSSNHSNRTTTTMNRNKRKEIDSN